MISCKIGNVLDVKSGIIVHGCNCQGVMGSGIAREIKERFPIVFETYHSRPLRMGKIIPVQLSETKWIVNAMTQYGFGHGKRQVDYDAVANVFEKVVELAKTLPVQLPILFPKIGAGLGGGDWEIIAKIIDRTVPKEFEKQLYVLSEAEVPSDLTFENVLFPRQMIYGGFEALVKHAVDVGYKYVAWNDRIYKVSEISDTNKTIQDL